MFTVRYEPQYGWVVYRYGYQYYPFGFMTRELAYAAIAQVGQMTAA